MGVTQKYKQQQQQVRIQTNESNYIKGMYFSDVPLAEGYSRVLVNYEIDPLSGALTPRKGLQSLGIIEPKLDVTPYLNNTSGYNTIVKSKVCAHSDSVDPRKTTKVLQGVLYNTDTKSLLLTTGDPNITESSRFDIVPFSTDASDEYVVTEPFIIAEPEVHGKKCVHNNFFKKPVGTFAFGNSYYTFVRRGNYTAHLVADLPNPNLPDSLENYKEVQNYADLMALTGGKGTPGNYFRFISGTSNGAIGYFDAEGTLQLWRRSEEALLHEVFAVDDGRYQLCYTKLGAEIQEDEQLLDKTIPRNTLDPNKYYTCAIAPDQINPTEAASWGYNMLLENPYDFKCEETAVNMITILGILPYGKDGLPVLTPRKNQEITLKGFYRAPAEYHSEAQVARYYATSKKRVTVKTTVNELKEGLDEGGNKIYYYTSKATNITHNVYHGYMEDYGYPVYYYYEKDESTSTTTKIKVDLDELVREPVEVEETRDPINKSEIFNSIMLYDETTDTVYNPSKTYYTRTGDGTTGNEYVYTEFDGSAFVDNVIYYEYLPEYTFGDWWHCTGSEQEPEEYYIVAPNKSLTRKHIIRFGSSKPAASVALNGLEEGVENPVRVRWQIRSTNGADWDTLYDDTFKLSEYYKSHGDHAPFIFTTTMPNDEVMVRLLITDPSDIVSSLETGEEYVLSTNTIGLSLVSDELANTLNLSAKNFNLGECTGMCEWEQRLVLWGVPGALDTLFISAVNNPTFFPYPNNIDLFPDPIIAVHNYGNELLVLTTSALYRLTWDTTTDTWTHKLVQQNLHITESDTYLSCVIKNMFFFKSRDYYYMMVPKVNTGSVRGEVSIAPISKTIETLLDNFHSEIYSLAKVIVDDYNLPDFTDRLVNYFSYVDNTRVVVNYVYDLRIPDKSEEDPYAIEHITDSKYLYVQLIYDTEARTWVMKMFEAAHMLYASHSDAIQQDHFIDITPALDGNQLTMQYYKFINTADDTIQYIHKNGAAQAVARKFRNYQYLDTGNREINTDLKKRFREFQFKIKNVTDNSLGFYTSFLVDGSLRRDLQKYKPRLITDDAGSAYVIVERELDPSSMSYSVTRIERVVLTERMLQDAGELTPTTLANEEDPDRWVLDQSAFRGRTITKVRMPLSGKGLAPRAILLSTNELDYTLFGHLWVYRTMHSR